VLYSSRCSLSSLSLLSPSALPLCFRNVSLLFRNLRVLRQRKREVFPSTHHQRRCSGNQSIDKSVVNASSLSSLYHLTIYLSLCLSYISLFHSLHIGFSLLFHSSFHSDSLPFSPKWLKEKLWWGERRKKTVNDFPSPHTHLTERQTVMSLRCLTILSFCRVMASSLCFLMCVVMFHTLLLP